MAENKNIIYLDIYKEVLNKKQKFEDKASLFYKNVVEKEWKENGRKKLQELPTDEALEYLGSKNSTERMAFLWFLKTDLLNCDKYILRDTQRHWNNDYKLMDFDSVANPHWYQANGNYMDGVCLIDVAKSKINDGSSYYRNKISSRVEVLKGLLPISGIEDLMSSGFSGWVSKNTQKKTSIPGSIQNKMQFIIWKKFIKMNKMSEKYYKQLTRTDFGQWKVQAYNELYKEKGLVRKKYFKNDIDKNWFYDVKDCNVNLAMHKLKQLGSHYDAKHARWVEVRIMDMVENVDLKTGSMTGKAFVDWFEACGTLKNLRFMKGENTFFSRVNFVNHLRKKYK